ncbi:MAG TPA: M1 family aminopeptidase, partial [bacterium]|nr:M1 family aminopeptidase [bacterium]
MIRRSAPGIALGALVAATAPAAAPVAQHEIRAALDVPGHRLVATDVVTLGEGPDGPWHFCLNAELEVASVRVDGADLDFAPREGWDPRRYWDRPPYAELDAFRVVREIRVEPPAGGWRDAPRIEIAYAGVIADSLHAPERAYGRSFESTTGRIVERGAYLDASTFWVPWSGEGTFTFDLQVEGPADWRAISQGRLADVPGVSDASRGTMRWVCEHPMEEVYLIAGPYVIERRDHGGISLETWVYADTPADVSRPYLDAAAEAIDRFSEQLGPYPFSKFALVENYWQTGYGMPGFTFLGDRVIRLPFIVHTSYPHEILHNWWGNCVFVDGGNWCEGLTTYGADYAAREREGGSAARDYRRDTLIGYRDFAADGGRDFALSRFRERDSAATQAVGYGKTLMVFHMLRRRLGDEAFGAALRRFYLDHRFRAASWEDVRASFEAETGEELEEFFAQWVQRPGAIRLSLDAVSRRRGSDGSWEVRGELVQAAPAFRAPVELAATAADGSVARTLVEIAGERTPFRWSPGFRPVRVSADGGFHLFRILHDEEVAPVLSGVLGARTTRIVLGADESDDVRAALRDLADAWAEDSTFAVVDEAG